MNNKSTKLIGLARAPLATSREFYFKWKQKSVNKWIENGESVD